jgi:hypothetical protein
LQVGDTGPVESARRSNSRVLGSPFSGLSGQLEIPSARQLMSLSYGKAGGTARPSCTKSHLQGHSPPASQAGRHVGPAL